MQHDDTIRISAVGVIHGIRNRQDEYSAKRGKNLTIAETYCGRHRMIDSLKIASKLGCRICIKAIEAEK